MSTQIPKGFHTGAKVKWADDERFVGRVEAIWGGSVRIKWEETDWLSDCFFDEVEIIAPVRWDADLGCHVRSES